MCVSFIPIHSILLVSTVFLNNTKASVLDLTNLVQMSD